MDDRRVEAQIFLANTKGAPLSVVVAMMFLGGGPVGVGELECICPYSRKTVSLGLQTLAGLRLVQQHTRYKGWMLTARARQMVLGEMAGGDGRNLPLVGSSSSSNNGTDHITTTTTTTGLEVRFLPLVDELTEAGAGPAAAWEAITRARDRGCSAAVVADLVSGWLSYCSSDAGATVRNPGALTASRVSAGIGPPVWFEPEGDFFSGGHICRRCGVRPCACGG